MWKLGGNRVRDRGLAPCVKALNGFLQHAIGVGDALMLAEMLDPGLDHEGLDEAPLLGRVFEDPPGEGAIAPALRSERGDGGKEGVAVLRIDPVLRLAVTERLREGRPPELPRPL